MTLPESIQPHVDAIKALLGGVPASQITINLSDDGKAQSVDARVLYRPVPVDRRNRSVQDLTR